MKPGDVVSVIGKVRVSVSNSEVRGWVEYKSPPGGALVALLIGEEKTVGAASREDIIQILNELGLVLTSQLTDAELAAIRKRLVGQQKKAAPKASSKATKKPAKKKK